MIEREIRDYFILGAVVVVLYIYVYMGYFRIFSGVSVFSFFSSLFFEFIFENYLYFESETDVVGYEILRKKKVDFSF